MDRRVAIVAMATLRPIRGQCLKRPTEGLLSLHISTPSASFRYRTVLPLQSGLQRRWQSNNANPQAKKLEANQQGKKPEARQITFRQFIGRTLSSSLRNLAYALSPRAVRTRFQESPLSMSIILGALFIVIVTGAISLTAFFRTFYGAQFHKFPEPVANSLRRAIYYTKYKPNPELAHRNYKKAMAQCKEAGLDHFSDEVIGIRIYIFGWLQSIGNYRNAADILEALLADCKKWVSTMEKAVKDGQIDERGMLIQQVAQGGPASVTAGAVDKAPAQGPRAGDPDLPETMYRKRERILAKAISMSVRLGELYSDEHVLEPEKSHAHLRWSVEESLREFARRRQEPKRPGETRWLTPTELGASMESLGHDYERKSQFQYAVPLFFQALRLCESPCHRATIMNNLGAVFAQQPIFGTLTTDKAQAPSEGVLLEQHLSQDDQALPMTRKESLEAALNWARNAYSHGQDVKGADRTPECDEACATALCTWGDAAALLGKTDLARRKYTQCVELSGKLGFSEGVKQGRDGLQRLTSAQPA